MIFKKEVTLGVTGPLHEEAALVLSNGIYDLIQNTPDLKTKPLYAFSWSLRDKDSNKSDDPNVMKVFEDFKEHGLSPHLLFAHYRARPADSETFVISCFYYVGKSLDLDVEGPNRIIVDGIEASLKRIAERTERAAREPVKQPPTMPTTHLEPEHAAKSEPPDSVLAWVKRRKPEIIVTTALTLLGGLGVVYVGHVMGWN